MGLQVSDDELVRQITEPETFDRDFDLELDVAMSKGVAQSLGASDFTVEMGVSVLEGGRISETAITIERDSLSFPLSGQGDAPDITSATLLHS